MGSDSKYNSAPGGYTYFNPRSRMGSDSKYNSAPGGYTDFNPRSRMGSDMKYLPELLKVQVFQSTLPHGERRRISKKMYKSGKFQSTLPHGERPVQQHEARDHYDISIHAPAWGATSPAFTSAPASTYFNPRSPHGERLVAVRSVPILAHFNPRSPHGERRLTEALEQLNEAFQSTLPAWGATICGTAP